MTTRPAIGTSEQMPSLDGGVGTRLDALARQLRRYVLIEGIGWVVAFVVVALTVQFLLDRWLHGLITSIRAALLLAVLAAAVTIAYRRLVRPLGADTGRAAMANLVERNDPRLASVLISAVRFAEGNVGSEASNSRHMMRSVVERAGQLVRDSSFERILDPTRMKRGAWAIAACAVFVLGMSWLAPDFVRVGMARNLLLRDVDWPRRTQLVVEADGFEIVAARGDDVIIEARAEGVQPRNVEIIYELADGQRSRESMVTVGSEGNYRYRYTRKAAEQEFTFELRGGDDWTDTYAVKLLDRPRVVSGRIRVVPPAYTGESTIDLGFDQRSAQVLEGSELQLRVETNKPVVSARLMAGNEAVASAEADGTVCTAAFRAERSNTFHFELTDDVGFENRRPMRFSVRVRKDEAPRVKLLVPGAGDMITPQAVLEVALTCTDQYGLSEVEVAYRVLREEAIEGQLSLPTFEKGAANYDVTFDWPVIEAGVQPNDQLTLQADAADVNNLTGPNRAQSAELSLRVVTADELLAELTRREQEYREAFERLIDTQEQIRGRLLSVQSSQQSGAPDQDDGHGAALSSLERQQRSLLASVEVIRQQLLQILQQLQINQLDNVEERERLGDKILAPLGELTRRDLSAAADAIRRWARGGGRDAAVQSDKLQVVAIEKMRSVLASMIQWEGYHEVVSMLRDIIRMQKELGDEAQKDLMDQADSLFED